MGVLAISFARVDKITTNFIFSVLPKAIRFLILVLGFVTNWYIRITSHYKFMSMINNRSFKFVYKRENLKQDLSRCTICLREISEGEVARTLQCEHTFHRSCLDRWLIRSSGGGGCSCPLCRTAVLPREAVVEYQLLQKDNSFEKELALFLLPTLNSGRCSNCYTLPTIDYL